MTENDKRLIEDYLPIEAISAEASREKSIRKGHASTLHLWWARRPLVACRAAVYGALVPASHFVPNGASDAKKKSLGRANAAKFVKGLCLYPGSPQVIREAQAHLMNAHAERLTGELLEATVRGGAIAWKDEFKFTGDRVTIDDIISGRAPRPRVLDMFAGGGAIPLEALRFGCEAYALDLNPVAYIIELCTLVYPQKFGKADPSARGVTGPKDKSGLPTWGGLATEVRYWGEWVLKKVKAEIGDLYPLIPDPAFSGKRQMVQADWLKEHGINDLPPGYLIPVAYLWTRTVICKNPNCLAVVPLVKQTWLCKKAGRYVALKMIAPRGKKKVRFEVIEAGSENGLGFDPADFSKAGNATCPFCGTVADAEYVQGEGCAKRVGQTMMAVVCVRAGSQGKVYVSADDVTELLPDANEVTDRLGKLEKASGIQVPNESIGKSRPSPNARGMSAVTRHGLNTFGDLFAPRQLLSLLHFTCAVRDAQRETQNRGYSAEGTKVVATYLALVLDRLADFNSSFCVHNYFGSSRIAHTFGRHALSMVWDFAEANPFHEGSGGWGTEPIFEALASADVEVAREARVNRANAMRLPFSDMSFDAIVTDPPYYDNVPYADISDFFYVWLKRSIGSLYPDHFASELTPKKAEATALASRHSGDMRAAEREYEHMMAESFVEANRVLKRDGQVAVVYAHKTTLGWSTLVEAMRKAGFTVTEAWPLDTEKPGRLVAQETASLASSIFLVARKREVTNAGNYEEQVRPELEQTVRERVETLWEMGVSGADLVIACVGAGLRAFTRFASVEYANGEQVPAERFLSEVETVVLENILARLSKEVGGKSGNGVLAGLDAPTRFYILWRYTYRSVELDAGEAIIYANGTHVELDGPHGLSSGAKALVEKKKSKYHLRDFSERGDDEDLGKPRDGQATPLIDTLHRVLWLMENSPGKLSKFLGEAQPNREQMRLVAQALAGPALKGGELTDVSPTGELAALAKLTANWRSVVEDATPAEREAQRAGQGTLFAKGDRR